MNDFTLTEYSQYLTEIKRHYVFINYDEVDAITSPHVIWRHDIDVSMHQALKLAQIEKDHGVKATYFIMLGSWFYDIRDHEIHDLIDSIKKLGHTIGLHFDFEYLPSGKISDIESFLTALKLQKKELEQLLNLKIEVFSYHNPTTISDDLRSQINLYKQADMINVYSDKFVNNYKYCSDSNGLWRFDRLMDLINPKEFPRLHILTHPEWWTEHKMTPREKIQRALMGRVKALLDRYDRALQESNRPNF
jgi:hypothetical protein